MPATKRKPAPVPPDAVFLTRREAAAILRQSVQNVDRAIQDEQLPAYRPVGRRVLIRRDDLLAFVAANPVWKKVGAK